MASLKETILSSADRERIQSPPLNKPKAKTVSSHQNGSDRNHGQQRNAVERKSQDKEEMSFRQEEEKARRSRLNKQGVKKNQLREEDRHQNKEERDRPHGLAQLQAWELRHQEGIKVESKKSSFKSQQDDISGRGSRRESVAHKLNLEKEDRKHLQCAEERKQLQIKNAQAEKYAMEVSHYHADGIEESLPRYGTDQTRTMKQKLERNTLLLSYLQNSDFDKQPNRLPPITTKAVTARTCLDPPRTEASHYYASGIAESLPRYGTAQTREIKQKLESNKLLLSYEDNLDFDMQPNCLPPIITKAVTPRTYLDPPRTEASHYYASGIEESLPRYGTAQSRAIKQNIERNQLRLSYEDTIEVRQQATPLPPITTTDKTECLVPAGMEAYQYRPKSVEELLPRCGSAQARALKHELEDIKLLLSDLDNSDVDMWPTRPLTVTTKKVDAGRFLDPAGIEASQYHANGIEESLPRYGTAQTRAMKQKMEGNKQLLSYQENTKGYKQATCLPPISTKKTTVGQCLGPGGIEASHDHAECVKESLPKYKTTQTRAIKKKLEETRKVNLLPKHLPPLSKKEAPAGPHCPPRVPEGSNYFFEQTGEQLPRYGTAQTRRIKQRQDQNKLFLK
ncbi:hypothetical protein CgunFtcFv8_007909 [Champsocephalus gunnari]|uniref:Uncharacterized protein n=1 Tax=Champsocephalus gunnari TaxID=52237 RepID=A0AAN8HF38_CHAGU|nr:hypothetical protein CgunFtcFv8_007909 [Champsocephalus gunnari]